MGALIHADQLRLIRYGLKVSRAAKVLPAGATESIFTVTGGRVRVTGLVGQVTTAADATVTNLSIVSTPAAGAALTLASVVAIASTAMNSVISLPATLGSALGVTAPGGGQSPLYELIIPPGSIQIVTSAANAGAAKWDLTYVPFDDAGSVAAA